MPGVAMVTLGCARNDVDSDEMRARLEADGFDLVASADDADVVIVNTCGFIASAKKDSIDAVLAVSDSGAKVVVTGCMAERYGAELAEALPEATAVLGFDDYEGIGDRVRRVMAGEHLAAHTPQDRRLLLPLSPVERQAAGSAQPGHAGLRRHVDGPVVSVKLASGCDRRCSFCAIPSFRGAFVSRRPEQVLDEIAAVVADGAREVVLVSENSTSYGKDLGDLRMLETHLPHWGALPGVLWLRASYLQPAEMRPGLVRVIASTPGVAPYFDLSFQHANPRILRRMRRFGGTDDFLGLVSDIRRHAPAAGIRTNVIVGFPGESEADLVELEDFLISARLDAVGVFGYSDEEGTEAVDLDGHVDDDIINERVRRLSSLVDELMVERAHERLGEQVDVLVLSHDDGIVSGRAAHQGPEDAMVVLPHDLGAAIGDVVACRVVDTDGPDLVAVPR